MTQAFQKQIAGFDDAVQQRFLILCDLVLAVSQGMAQEKLWAKLPSFYMGERFVRIIPFRDHINLEAAAVTAHIADLSEYRVTPKGMLQLYQHQPLPMEMLKIIIKESLCV